MISEMNVLQFVKEFNEVRPNCFTKAGLASLFIEFLSYVEDTGCDVEFDPIAMCGQYSEYENFDEFHKAYPEIEDFDELYDLARIILVDDDGFIVDENTLSV